MKRLVFLIFMSFLICNPCFAQDGTAEWVTFTGPDGSYSVMFPAQPEEKIKTNTDSKTVMHLYVGEKFVLISGCTDYNVPIDKKAELEANRDNFLKAVGGTLATSREIEFQKGPNEKLPALTFTGEGGDYSYKGLIIVDNQRSYMFVAKGNGNVLTTIEKFLDSVRLYTVQK